MNFIEVNNGQNIIVKIKANVAQTFTFPVQNISNQELELVFSKVSCSCTQLDTLTARLAPGDTKIVNGTVLRGTSAIFEPNITFNSALSDKLAEMQTVTYNIHFELT